MPLPEALARAGATHWISDWMAVLESRMPASKMQFPSTSGWPMATGVFQFMERTSRISSNGFTYVVSGRNRNQS